MLENADNPRTIMGDVINTEAKPREVSQRPDVPNHALHPQTWQGLQNRGTSLPQKEDSRHDIYHNTACAKIIKNVLKANSPNTEVVNQHFCSFERDKSQAQ